MTKDRMKAVQDKLPSARQKVLHCGPLEPPHQNLGIGVAEGVLTQSDGTTNHLIVLFKFVETEDHAWELAGIEPIIDFTQ
jgi:hypothetical protein